MQKVLSYETKNGSLMQYIPRLSYVSDQGSESRLKQTQSVI
jgi:hypothetical protein